ncbi:MAG: Ig-like domain-containing protein [Pyrinomonadaceae bacterium]
MFALCTHAPRVIFMLAVAALGLPLFAQSPPVVKTVKVSSSMTEGEVGEQMKFTATAYDGDGKELDLKPQLWAAVPADLAAVDKSGTATFFAPGEVRIVALIGKIPGTFVINVKPAPLKSIEIEKHPAALIVGGAIKLQAKAIGENGDPREDVTFTWSSENTSVAVVDDGGSVSAIAPGKVKIRATAEKISNDISIEVINSNITGLDIEPRHANARTGDVIRFAAQVSSAVDKPMTSAAVRWAVSGDGAGEATIDRSGDFVAERPGTYLVTASVGERSTVAAVTVIPRHAERSLDLIGRIKLKDLQVSEQWLFGNYIYVSTISDQVQVYDISDPANPKLTETVKVDARIVNDISVTPDGKIGVLTREGASNRKNGIVFLDTADPAHPKIISEFTETVTGGVHSAFIDGHYVYLTDDTTGSMRVIDFADVRNPKEVAQCQVESRAPKATANGPFSQGRYLHDVQVKDGLAYLAYWRDGLVIFDVGNGIKGGTPENPKLVSQLRFNHHELYGDGWIAGTHEVFRYKNYVFVGDEVLPGNFDVFKKDRIPARGVLHVVDVSDLEHPRKVAEYAVPEGGAHNVWVKDDILVMGYYGGGGRVLDVSGELRGDLYRQGREITRLWTGDPEGFRPNLPFTWGARQHGQYIYFNDINSGIWVMKLGQPKRTGSTTSPGE